MKNNNQFFTIVSADHYQYYIPMYLYTIAQAYPCAHTEIHVRGNLAEPINAAICLIGNSNKISIFEDMYTKLPEQQSLTNSLRFLFPPLRVGTETHVLITDIDFLFFGCAPNLFEWHTAGIAASKLPYHGHHGPYKHPYRPEINGGRWEGDFERVAGGFLYVDKSKWYPKTSTAREMHFRMIKTWKRQRFREADEVMLARIIKESGMPVPQSKYFPPELRGIHLGDFKPAMNHRWTNIQKMEHKLPRSTIEKYIVMRDEKKWQEIIKIVRKCQEIDTILQNIDTHIRERGF